MRGRTYGCPTDGASDNNRETGRRSRPPPRKQLGTGAEIPAIGLDTFGSDHIPGEAVAEAVLDAARAGYRHFDCAAVYGNERLIGESLRQILSEGVRREDLGITSNTTIPKLRLLLDESATLPRLPRQPRQPCQPCRRGRRLIDGR